MPAAPDKAGALKVCPTPIGNLDDVTLRVLAVLADADVVACEDTRHTSRLLARHGIRASLVSFHEHNEGARAPQLVRRMRAGAVVALVSDAGTPLVSDPGYELVRACLQAGVAVEVLPGPTAVTTAVVASGLPADRWLYVGFLPRARARLAELLQSAPQTLVALESPRRLAATLGVLADGDPDRPVAVCRELTKRHEEVRRGSARQLAGHYTRRDVRGEIVLVIGAAQVKDAGRAAARQALMQLLDAGARPRPAAAVVASLTGVRANELYRELANARR